MYKHIAASLKQIKLTILSEKASNVMVEYVS